MTDTERQQQIRTALEVIDPAAFDAAAETERRIGFLTAYLRASGTEGFVLGISGGVDSTVAGRLAQVACERVRVEGGQARFAAVRLPYHVQKDEHDAVAALQFIGPDEAYTVDIGPGVDAQWEALLAAGAAFEDAEADYHRGNLKARHRMVAQYAIAGGSRRLVLGTDQAAEAAVGFYTKFGDGAADLVPLFGLPKRRVRQIGRHLGCPEHLVEKVPTADLENDKPLLADEVALGVSYAAVDDYLEGKDVSAQDEATILGWYHRTAHKRALPVTPAGFLQDR